ncbi:MAG: hypothetical protein H6Q91_1847 [Deltaproteobacteria bacterium]|jgi:hypothetical protein|nr:hypothetical protein [Deltaproteobacteria bacterium]
MLVRDPKAIRQRVLKRNASAVSLEAGFYDNSRLSARANGLVRDRVAPGKSLGHANGGGK